MAMPPVCSDLCGCELVHEGCAWYDGTLGCKRGAVFEGGIPLLDTMEVDRGALVSKAVVDIEDENITIVQNNSRVRPLSVDSNHGT